MSKGCSEQTILAFPVMQLAGSYHLRYGIIGPASRLLPDFPNLSVILKAFDQCRVDGKRIQDPVFAASTSDTQKFLAEVEVIAFLAASSQESYAAEEIFGNLIAFTFKKLGNAEYISLNGHAFFTPPENLLSIILEDFPKEFHRWDVKKISEFEAFLSKSLQGPLFEALGRCLPSTKDKELEKERRRIITSLELFNEARVHLALFRPFSNSDVVLSSAAMEALLDLPSEDIGKSFQHSVAMLLGGRTSSLKKWCREFYEYRSAIVHGEASFHYKTKAFPSLHEIQHPHSFIASCVFIHCLKTKLYLMGLFPEYVREDSVDKLFAKYYRDLQ